ncbi:hypothetical protein [Desulfovibrio sp. TomC]|uniref:hypothetical protein n=1 Tax=Desulfovibrio sp. TomC TaxID=1562888 RepID=UPI000575209F|nr:hypothetical protein [Desulfovibrio sp. TomC]KHK03947.1 putative membrane protein [Desulfovibrio sp. TomC]
MLLKPVVLALILVSGLIGLTMIYAAWQGVVILRHFDLANSHPRQLALERKTYLISTILSYVMLFELLSLFLFIYAGEDLHHLFVGAMCAVGTFTVNSYGYTALLLKIASSLGCGIWLIINHLDNQGYDYPLIRTKYAFLLPLTALVLFEAYVQFGFFAHMAPNRITSCCGAVFSDEATTLTASLAHLPPALTQVLFWGGLLALIRSGIHFLATGQGARLFAWIAASMFVIGILAVLSFISVYWYELPTHHCPFCLLKAEYDWIGYPLYAALLLLGICGAGVGAVEQAAGIPSLAATLPRLQRRLCQAALVGAGLLAAIALWPLLVSDFTLG